MRNGFGVSAADVTDVPRDVTVVVPTRDRRDLLLQTVRSVLAQQEADVQVVVVVDGGDDGSEAALRELGDRRVRVLRHERSRGVSAARNSGLADSTTTWTAFIDDDDLMAPRKLAEQLAALARTRSAGWSCVGALYVDGRLTAQEHHAPPHGGDVSTVLLRSQVVPGGGSGVLVRTSLARTAGGFDERISVSADWDFYIRLALLSEMASVATPLLAYRVHASTMSSNIQRSVTEYRYLARKHAAARAARDVRLDRSGWSLYIAGVAWRSGARMFAVQRMLLAIVLRPTLPTLLVVVRTVLPRLAAAWRLRRRGPAPASSEPEWLGDLRRAAELQA